MSEVDASGSQARGPKHDPIRMCVGCRTRWPQRQLTRIARRSDGHLFVVGGPAPSDERVGRSLLRGRSAYLCQKPDCLRRVAKGAVLAQAFRGAKVTTSAALLASLAERGLPSSDAAEPHRASEGGTPDERGAGRGDTLGRARREIAARGPNSSERSAAGVDVDSESRAGPVLLGSAPFEAGASAPANAARGAVGKRDY